jgi:hypothetical protein
MQAKRRDVELLLCWISGSGQHRLNAHRDVLKEIVKELDAPVPQRLNVATHVITKAGEMRALHDDVLWLLSKRV